jgi:HTH-type transcriptional regulator, sugar sensing transcriptional regulator
LLVVANATKMLYKSFSRLYALDARSAIEELQNLGLTRYEAMCYVALAKLGPADPRKVGSEAGIPLPNAYEALRRLTNKGWAEMIKKKPMTYRARRPDSVRETLMSHLDETFDALTSIYNTAPADEAELVYTLRGRERVLSKIHEMIEGANESLILVSPTLGLDKSIIDSLKSALNRGVKVRAVLDEEGRSSGTVPEGIELRTGNLVAVDVLADDKAALISLPDYSACGWVDSPQVAGHFKQFLELMWNNSRLN